ncbi:major facilitator superfamily domain-containing protein [Crepidotus variabilis]|uniref:Major facilitator superfamily domain-containing protein n=1 Tax=Crepidotus variabilis TaxID=179855 RepID=A0A9P6JQB5_9AGAR|nr:major facilitator superfamily domain-containing protein [Crepidotus variabilis]
MVDLIRDSTVGFFVNRISGGRVLPFNDQRPDYIIPNKYLISPVKTEIPSASDGPALNEKLVESAEISVVPVPTRPPSPPSPPTTPDRLNSAAEARRIEPRSSFLSGNSTLKNSDEADLESGSSDDQKARENEVVEDVQDIYVLVDWDGLEDPENPRNWSFRKRAFVVFAISLLTFSIYIGSAIYTSSIPSLMETFDVPQVMGSLGLTLYVMAYGIGPMFLSPLQELPSLGRNPVYIATLALFVIFNVPIATAKNFSTILAFRFLTGFAGSPALASSGASMGDIFPPHRLPYAIGIWALGAVAGPIAGPVIGGFAAQANGWKWPIYELLWISGFSLIFLSLLLPETMESTILLRRAQRLRKLTGNPNLRSQSEIDQANMSRREVAYESLVRPFILAMDPAVLFANLYLGLVYSVFYLWFEAFPLVFNGIYEMKLGVGSLPYLGFIVSGALTYTVYCFYLRYHLEPRYAKHGMLKPEVQLEIGLIGGISIPISLFMFGWTSRPSVHWIAPVIAAAIYLPGIFLSFQSILMYLAMSYPKYKASVFAGNTLFRSVMASVFPLFGTVFFKNLGVGPGSSLLAGISLALIVVYFFLVKYGHILRMRSKYAQA